MALTTRVSIEFDQKWLKIDKRLTVEHKVPRSLVETPPSSSGTSPQPTPGPHSLAESPAANGTGAGGSDFSDDPLFKLLSEMKSGMGGAGGAAGSDGSASGLPANPFEAFSSLFGDEKAGATGVDSPQAGTPMQQQQQKQADFWPPLHTLLTLVLSVYVCVIQRRPEQLVWLFCSLEIALIAGRFVVERGAPPDSTIARLAGFLPEPFRGYIVLGSRYLHVLRALWRDLCVALFVLALSSGSSSRPAV